MAASHPTMGKPQDAVAEPRVDPQSRPADDSARVGPGATDDEILGLTTNVRRRNLSGARAPADAAQEAKDIDQLELGLASKDGERGVSADRASSSSDPETQETAQDGRAKSGNNSLGAAADAAVAAGAAEPAHLKAAFDAAPELRTAWHEAKAYRETFATPQEARAATGMLADLNRMDALFFSRRPEDHAQLARAVAEMDPVAFASLARAMTQIAQTAGVTFPAIAARSAASHGHAGEQSTTVDVRSGAHDERPASSIPRHAIVNSSAGATPAQEQFFHSTNASAVEGVVEAIEAQVDRLLPEGISKSARNRVVGEIYSELDSTLRANRTLTQQMRDAFRSGALDGDHQKAVVSLITGRARQALPGVAKRVLNEWTTTVVSANQQRRERQRTAERRVDIGGAGGAGAEGRHSMGPREINYARMSDADILNL
ncbi:MAG TPA: hypothetical protein VN861_10680 [Candidatus Acidoferrales bacterium]|nr:hypothetical protein [Candidatus Acidoferrales bacterium]